MFLPVPYLPAFIYLVPLPIPVFLLHPLRIFSRNRSQFLLTSRKVAYFSTRAAYHYSFFAQQNSFCITEGKYDLPKIWLKFEMSGLLGGSRTQSQEAGSCAEERPPALQAFSPDVLCSHSVGAEGNFWKTNRVARCVGRNDRAAVQT